MFFDVGEPFLPEYRELGWMTARGGKVPYPAYEERGYERDAPLRKMSGDESNFLFRSLDPYGPDRARTVFTRAITILAHPDTLDLVLITKNALGEIYP